MCGVRRTSDVISHQHMLAQSNTGTGEQDAQSNTGNRGTLGTKGQRETRHRETKKQNNGLRGTQKH